MVIVGTDSHTTTHGAHGGVRVRHRRDRDGGRLGARHDLQRRGAGDDQGRRQRHAAGERAAEGPDPAPGRQADGRGRQLQGDRVPRRGDPPDADVGPPGALQHVGRSRRDRRHRAVRPGDAALPARRGRRQRSDRRVLRPIPTPGTTG